MGAAGRDFHNFNTYFRDRPAYEVVAFTATQIPGIADRRYPTELAGPRYPLGIPIHPEQDLADLIRHHQIDQVIFAYSDVSHETVMHVASQVLACGADFRLLGPHTTMLRSQKPVVAITAVRTGCGKSQTTRYIGRLLLQAGFRVAIVRHPMPYGDLKVQAVQRFATYDDLDRESCTIEEREEYEPLIANGLAVFAGIDYEAILRRAERQADIILWDGGNNDFSFYRPDLSIVVVDPHRAGDETLYHPGETNLRMADVVIINKIDSADPAKVESVRTAIAAANPAATVVLANSRITSDPPDQIHGQRVLVIEDGPTITHGQMAYGAGVIAAERQGARELVDPRPYASGSIAETFRKWPQIGPLLPAMGYSQEQIEELESTINLTPADRVIFGTPIDLRRFMTLNKPAVRIFYELEEIHPQLESILKERLPWPGKLS
ncbi:MAG: GTPase [Clostridia bacterium]|nr:GTPase [Clostridia bacterium]